MSIVRHTSYNVVGAVIPIAISLITVPLYIQIVGLDRYGVLALCWLLVGYFGFFDFGVGQAATQQIAAHSSSPAAVRSRIFWSGFGLALCLAIVAALLFVPISKLALPMVARDHAALRGEIVASLPLLAFAVPLGIMQSLLAGALEGREKFFKVNLIVTAGMAVTTIAPLLTAYYAGNRLDLLILASMVTRVAIVALLFLACVGAVPLSLPKTPHGAEVKRLLRFGAWTTVTNIVGPILSVFDRFAIGALLGAAAVGLYVIPFNLVSQLALLPASVARALFPRVAAMDELESKAMAETALRLLACVLTPATLTLALVLGPFLELWLGKQHGSAATPVGYLLLFGFWANSLAKIAISRLQALGRPRFPALAHTGEVVPYAVVLYAGLTWMGLMGAAIAWSARAVIDAIILGLGNRFDPRIGRSLAWQSVPILASIALSLWLPSFSAVRWLALAVITVGTIIFMFLENQAELKDRFRQLRMQLFNLGEAG